MRNPSLKSLTAAFAKQGKEIHEIINEKIDAMSYWDNRRWVAALGRCPDEFRLKLGAVNQVLGGSGIGQVFDEDSMAGAALLYVKRPPVSHNLQTLMYDSTNQVFLVGEVGRWVHEEAAEGRRLSFF